MIPPGIKVEWIENTAWAQARLLAYHEVRSIEESEESSMSGMGVLAAMFGKKK